MHELRLNPPQIQAAIAEFTLGKQPEFDPQVELGSLNRVLRGRPDMVRIFVEIQTRAALAGSNLAAPARAALQRSAAPLGVSRFELVNIEAMLRISRDSFKYQGPRQQSVPEQLSQAYRVLGVEASVSDAELATAYRRQLSRHHPDKLKANGLPESMLEHAKERTQQIIEAYELIKTHRPG
jgi:DnaJ like chaperone protein